MRPRISIRGTVLLSFPLERVFFEEPIMGENGQKCPGKQSKCSKLVAKSSKLSQNVSKCPKMSQMSIPDASLTEETCFFLFFFSFPLFPPLSLSLSLALSFFPYSFLLPLFTHLLLSPSSPFLFTFFPRPLPLIYVRFQCCLYA